MGLILYIVSIFLAIPTFLLSFIHILFSRGRTKGYLKTIDGYLEHLAIDIDRFGNSAFKSLWNAWFITKEGYKFGVIQETMSSVFGKNKALKTLTKSGKFIAWVLNAIEKNHVEIAAEKHKGITKFST